MAGGPLSPKAAVVAASLWGASRVSAIPDLVTCGQAVEVGSILMAGLPAEAETALNFADVVVTRAGGEAVPCGSTVAAGEALEVSVDAASGSLWLLDASSEGFFGGGSSCGGRRATATSAALMPGAGDVAIRAGFAKAYGAVTVTDDCVLTVGGASAAPSPAPSPPAGGETYETDVLVVGAGLAGLTAAWAAKRADPDARVAVLAASLTDVTTAYSGGWLWLPNNGLLAGVDDPLDAFLDHAASIAYPESGAPEWALASLETFWEHAPEAMAALKDADVFDWALQYDLAGEAFPDYYGAAALYPNNTLPRGRVLRATDAEGAPLAGAQLLPPLRAAADLDLTLEGYVADDVALHGDGSATVAAARKGGADGGGGEGAKIAVTARRGVVLATGGKVRDLVPGAQDAANYGLDATVVGTCASPDSKGAALDAVAALPGVDVVNKGNSWMYEVDASGLNTQWFLWFGQPGGDFVVVDATGKRVYNEGLGYNQRGEYHLDRVVDGDGESEVLDHPDRSQLFLVYGDAAKGTYGPLIDSEDTVATTLKGAAAAVENAEWFAYDALRDGFEANLVETLDAFNAGATSTTGDDPMGRGVPGTTAYESSIAWWQFAFAYLGGAAPPTEDLEFPNPLTQPFWTAGDDGSQTPLYVRPLNFGSIDTKFGPKCDRDMRVVGTSNVFAAGNAAASPFGQTYAAPGNTLGFALVSGYVAGTRAAARGATPAPTAARTLEWTGEAAPVPGEGYFALPRSAARQVLHLAYGGSVGSDAVVLSDGSTVDGTRGVVVARSYDGHPWEGLAPTPLEVDCDAAGACGASLPAGLWLLGFDAAQDEAPRAAASRFLGQATWGPTTESIADLVDHFEGDAAKWIADQMALPATRHRDYLRKRAFPRYPETCGPYDEAGTDEALGSRYSWYVSNNRDGQDGVDVRYDRRDGKGMVFTNVCLTAADQLRQRVAWALSHVYVVAVDGVAERDDDVEVWQKWHDIFVDNAFGNLRDVLRAISFSPMMATYLTFRGSEQYDGDDTYPDENFAREFLQLFTVGLLELNDDGTPTGAETYDADDILTGARAWTGFDVDTNRGGIEQRRNENFVDDLRILPERRDPFPKGDLRGGYVGDRAPLCADVEAMGAVGATFEYVGADAEGAEVLDDASPLKDLLCAATSDGACAFPRTVQASVEAFGDAARRVAVVETRRRGVTAVYDFAPPPCVALAWYEDAAAALDARGRGLCRDRGGPFWHGASLVDYEGGDCDVAVQVHSSGAVNVLHAYGPGGERAWELAVDSGRLFRVPWRDGAAPSPDSGCGDDCLAHGPTCLCPTQVVVHAPFAEIPSAAEALETLFFASPVGDPKGDPRYAAAGASADGSVEAYAVVDGGGGGGFAIGDGGVVGAATTVFALEDEVGHRVFLLNKVSTVHVAGGFAFRNAPHFVEFAAAAPSAAAALAETEAVIDSLFEHPNTGPYICKILIQRFVTSNPSPRYVANVVSAFRAGAHGGVAYSGSYGDLGAAVAAILLDREARSSALLADPTHGRLREPLLKVIHVMRALELDSKGGREVRLDDMTQQIGQFFHEAPSVFSYYLPDYVPGGAVGDRLLYAPEAQVMTGQNLIGLANGLRSLVVHGLSRCNQGFGGGTGTCQWPADGGLAYEVPVSDRTKECSREADQRDYRGDASTTKTGLKCQAWDSQKPHAHKFSTKTHPELEANYCRQPKTNANSLRKRAWCFTTDPKVKWDYCDVPRCGDSFDEGVDDLDVLLTEGRLSDHSRRVILDKVNEETNDWDRLKMAEQLFTLAPEFHATNAHVPLPSIRDDVVIIDPPEVKYKAVVLLFLNGGQDSFTVLTPHSACSPVDVAQQYRDYRGPIAEMPFDSLEDYLPIDAGSDQPCDVFGMHPSLPKLKELYDAGDAAWFANIGSLVEPLTLADYQQGAKRTPPSIGAHDVQQRVAQQCVSDQMNAKGVLGRMLSVLADPHRDDPLNAVGYSLNGMQKALEGSGHAEVVDLNNDNGFATLVDYDDLKEQLDALLKNESRSVFADTFAGLFGSAVEHAEEIDAIFDGDDGLVTEFPNTGLGRRFEDVAKLVTKRDALGHERAAFFVEIGGFDTHGTLNNLPMKLEEIDDALAAFADEMKAQGIFEDVAVATMSDFGRTLTWNGQGTDHGWAGHHMIMGGSLNGTQIHGRYPKTLGPDGDLNYSPGRGRVVPSTPWESLWLPLAEFMGVDEANLDFVIPNRANFPDVLRLEDVFRVGPTAHPTFAPSSSPTVTHEPTPEPTPRPTLAPTVSKAPTSHPTLVPTISKAPTSNPTLTFAPTGEHVCGGVPGVRKFATGELHCLDIGYGELVDVFPVENGLVTRRFDDPNSCPDGMDIWVPTSLRHAAAVRDAMGEKFVEVAGVYREDDGCGGCQWVAMNEKAQGAWESQKEGNLGFTSVRGPGKPWFLASKPRSEPNGDYDAGCWLTLKFGKRWDDATGFYYNDGSCNYRFTRYLCSSNRMDAFGPSPQPSYAPTAAPTVTPEPTAAPTTAKPTPRPTPAPSPKPSVSPYPTATPSMRPTLDHVCPGEGVFDYGDFQLHCLYVDIGYGKDVLVDVIEVQNGLKTCSRFDEDSCPAGFDIWVPLSWDHAKAITDRFPYERNGGIKGIYREANSCGGCTKVAMNSDAQAEYEAEGDDHLGWTSLSYGDDWFLRSVPYSEPNGDYSANCWLATWGFDKNGFRFNDQNCNACRTRYLCSTNRPPPAPTLSPTISPAPSTATPTLSPTISPAPSTATPTRPPVCEAEGIFDYMGLGAVHCIAVAGGFVNAFPVENGKRTCSIRDETSCPDGMDLYVPFDYEHAEAIYETFGSKFTKIAGVYREEDGFSRKDFKDVPMNSKHMFLYEKEEPFHVGFRSVIEENHAFGGKWFLRSEPHNQPSGNYEAGCWLWTAAKGDNSFEKDVGFSFDDRHCYACSRNYLCSSNQLDRADSGTYAPSTMAPSSVPTTNAPTPTPKPTEPAPTMAPVAGMTMKPTAKPSAMPTDPPTMAPTTAAPTASPTPSPSSQPTTAAPTPTPTPSPTSQPTGPPTPSPTPEPTLEPTVPCVDSTSWKAAGPKPDFNYDCVWIGKSAAKREKRCKKAKDSNGIPASDACIETCETC